MKTKKPSAERVWKQFEDLDFLKHPSLRRAIHLRERGRCFYCLSRLTVSTRCIDHVVPLAELQDNSFRNLVSCCRTCNLQKSDLPAEGHLHRLYDDGRLTAAQFTPRPAPWTPSLPANSVLPSVPNTRSAGILPALLSFLYLECGSLAAAFLASHSALYWPRLKSSPCPGVGN